MLSSLRTLEFEPRLPPSPSHDRTYRNSRSNFSTSVRASTTSLSISPPNPSPSASSCISPSSVFYQVLTAQYRHPAPALVRQRSPVDPQHAETCRRSINWIRRHFSDESHVESNSAGTKVAALERQIYIPHGRWAWADGQPIIDTEELMKLECGMMCSATIRRGTLGTRQINYISKCWNTAQQDRWNGFYSELALYKAEHYLKCLQGDILPWIIGVYSLPGTISIAMEPPHHSFWIEASPDMPNVLKQRCIKAFENIHQRGVLHGDVELRHMLIGGDCKVTIINFQMSRSLVPNADVMLLQAEPWELSLEMRKVKYKLDYDGTRKREIEKMMRGEERNRRNGARQTDSGAGVQHEDIPEEDIVDPPIHIQDWNESWANAAANATPTRFVMPGQPTEALANEVQNFLDIVDRISTGSLTLARSEHRQVRFASEAPSNVFVDNLPWEASRTLPIHNSTHSYSMRKRKASERSESSGSIDDTRFAKHSRSGGDLIMSLSPDIDEPIHPNLPAEPVLVNYMANDTNNNDRFTPPTESADAFPGTVPLSANPSLRFPPIKVRDFAYESYDGPRGYYAPYPLMESVISLNRRRWIRLQNQACVELGLPIPQPLSKIPTRSSHLSTRKHSKSESAQSLGLSKGRTVTEGVPVPVQKRKRGDQETEMSEEDFEEDDRRANKVFINMDRNGHRLSARSLLSDPLDLRRVQYPYERESQQSQHHRPNRVPGSRTDHMVFADRATPPGRNVSFKYPKVSDKIAFATLGRRPPASRQRSISKARTRLSDDPTEASQSYGGPPPGRNRRPSVSWQRQEPIDPYLSLASEDEVEALLSPPRVAVSPPPRSLPLVSSWMGLLLQWIL